MINWRVFLMSITRRGNLCKLYKRNLAHQYQGNEETIKQEMKENAENIFFFHLKNNPQYRKFLDDKGFDYSNPEKINWEEIPIITKNDLREYNPEVKSEIYNYSSSGGSTNSPFKYPASKECALNIWPAHWLMYEMCGGKPYDSMLMLMGYGRTNRNLQSTAYGNTIKKIVKKVYHKLSNFHTFNAFEMNNKQMHDMYNCILSNKINFIYGYSSAINQFLRFLKDNNLECHLKGIFTTSDNKINSSYTLAQKYCHCNVFDQYGAHDGDVFTFECTEHAGLHILHDMCTLEIVNNEIILTAVKNKAFPFIRYKVGDIALGDKLITEKCKCGRTLFRLKGISGRNSYYLKDSNGKEVSVMLFTFPLDLDTDILQYQIQDKDNEITINIISDTYNANSLREKYNNFFIEKLGREVKFVVNAPLYKLKNGKAPLLYKL